MTASKSPSSWARPRRVQRELKMTFPAKYTVHPPIGVDVKRDYAEYHVEFTNSKAANSPASAR